MNVKKVLVVITTVFTIVINSLANLLPINNQTTAQISDSFPIFFVPAGYVFSIWGIIYLGLILFSIYISIKKTSVRINKILVPVIISNLANSVWIILWHYNQPVLSLGVMVILLVSLLYIYLNFNLRKDLNRNEYLFVKIPFSIYLGWISVATIANAAVALYVLQWNGLGIAEINWAIIMIFVAAVLGVFIGIRKRDIFYSLVIVWALIGISAKFPQEQNLFYSALVSGWIVGVGVIYTVVKKIILRKYA